MAKTKWRSREFVPTENMAGRCHSFYAEAVYAGEDMYKAQQQAGGQNPGAGFDPNNMGGAGQQGGSTNHQSGNGDDNVTDVDYEEVK